MTYSHRHSKRGFHAKYRVERTDGKDVSGQEFFVLRIDPGSEDRHAMAAIATYARLCWRDKPELAHDLRRKIRLWRTD